MLTCPCSNIDLILHRDPAFFFSFLYVGPFFILFSKRTILSTDDNDDDDDDDDDNLPNHSLKEMVWLK
jgi:hypothetical protein